MFRFFSKLNSYFRNHTTKSVTKDKRPSNSEEPSSSHQQTETIATAVQPTTASTTPFHHFTIPPSPITTSTTTPSIPIVTITTHPPTPIMSETTDPSTPAGITSASLLAPMTTSTTTTTTTPSTPTMTSPSTPSTPIMTSTMTPSSPTVTNPLASGASAGANDNQLFMQAYDCAKNNYSWHKIISAIASHPDWLTRIPDGRRWTILHQIVYFGNVAHLDEILALEISNDSFRFLYKTLDDKTAREVAAERAHIHPQMLRHVERIVASDQLLHNARDGKWELVKQFLRQQPDIVNEKPAYRKLYLAHYLASTGQLDIFKDLSTICKFKLDLKAENKTISEIARENHHIEFAEYIENIPQNNQNEENDDSDDNAATGSDSGTQNPTTVPVLSQGFYDDPGIMIFSFNSGNFSGMLLSQDPSSSYPSHNQHHHGHASNHAGHSGHSSVSSHVPAGVSVISEDDYENSTYNEHQHQHESNKTSETSAAKPMSEAEQQEYEKTVTDNINKFSSENLLNAITCCITKAILKDPVVAADGFTYEREAILNWFKTSNRSPMTNQVLENTDLKTNHAVKAILQSLYDVKTHDKTDEESHSNGDKKK